MGKSAIIVVPLLFAALLSGCAVPAPDQSTNPLKDLDSAIDLIPWAKSVAADASAEQLTARIAEISAGLPSVNLADATKTDVQNRLSALGEAVAADPSNAAAHVAELNGIIDEIAAAVQ